MNVFITKYALTAGIYECAVDHIDTDYDIVAVIRPVYGTAFFHGEGREWHRTLDGANARVRVMATKKLKSLEAQIKKVQLALARGVPVLRNVGGTWR